MAEPIRRVAPPARRRPLHGARPHPRPRPVLWTGEETEISPTPQPRPATSFVSASPEPEPPRTRTWTRAFRPVAEKKLRTFLLTALGLHAAALALPFLFPSVLPAPRVSDTLLASAVLLAGSAILGLGALGRRAG